MSHLLKTKNKLHIKSTIGDLISYNFTVDKNIPLHKVLKNLNTDNMIPGVIIIDENEYFGFISRKNIFEELTKPYGLELYLNKPLINFFESIESKNTFVFPSSINIVDAVYKISEGPKELFYEPVLIKFPDGSINIIDSYELILANSEINRLAMKALEEVNEFKTEIMSIVAHDLKNPIGAILNFSKFMLEDAKNLNLITFL